MSKASFAPRAALSALMSAAPVALPTAVNAAAIIAPVAAATTIVLSANDAKAQPLNYWTPQPSGGTANQPPGTGCQPGQGGCNGQPTQPGTPTGQPITIGPVTATGGNPVATATGGNPTATATGGNPTATAATGPISTGPVSVTSNYRGAAYAASLVNAPQGKCANGLMLTLGTFNVTGGTGITWQSEQCLTLEASEQLFRAGVQIGDPFMIAAGAATLQETFGAVQRGSNTVFRNAAAPCADAVGRRSPFLLTNPGGLDCTVATPIAQIVIQPLPAAEAAPTPRPRRAARRQEQPRDCTPPSREVRACQAPNGALSLLP